MQDEECLPTAIQKALERKRQNIIEGALNFASEALRKAYPWRAQGRSPYEVLLAEVLLKRTTATAAARVYEDVLKRFPTLHHLHAASIDEIGATLATIGLQFQRARSLKALAAYLVEHEHTTIPADLGHLLRVPGLGAYSSRAILSFAFNIPRAVVDSNIERVLHRVFYLCLPERPTLTLYQLIADRLLTRTEHRQFNFAMLDLGALICRPVVPLCEECPLKAVCDYGQLRLSGQVEGPAHIRPQTVIVSPLRLARQRKGLTLSQLAKLSGVTKRTLISIELGRTKPSVTTLTKVAHVLELDASELGARVQ